MFHKFSDYNYVFFEQMPIELYERYIRKFYKENMKPLGGG